MPGQTVGQHMLSEIFPEDTYTPGEVFDKKSVKTVFQRLAEKHPEDYARVADAANRFGRDTGEATNGGSFSVSDMATPVKAGLRRAELKYQIGQILNTLPPAQQNEAIVKILANAQRTDAGEVYKELEETGNPLATIVKGAGRGNPAALARLVGSDLMYADNSGKPIPIPILRSYSQGLTPGEFLASTFGARKGINEAKLSVASGGYMAKLVTGAAHRMVVTGMDAEEALADSASSMGLPVDVDDEDNVGALLAKDVGPYTRNTPLTSKILADIKKRGHDEILVRSPITTADPDGGVYARDVGHRQGDRLPEIGSAVGITAAQSISEPITQSVLSAKHKGGLAEEDKGLAGFELIDKLFNTPKAFREAATYTEVDGQVESIKDAPQGGKYVQVAGQRYFVPRDVKVTAKKGQIVEAGDPLSDGPINPRMVFKHKGLGEGARQFTYALRDAIRGSGMYANRRNIELIAKGLANRVRMTGELGDYSPGDLVPYNEVAKAYVPRLDAKTSGLQSVAGRYLESPALHYTIGTRVTPSVVNRLKKHGINQIMTHKEPPPFESEMVRAADLLQSDSDWMTRQVGTGLQKGLLGAVHRAEESDAEGTSFVAGRARGVDFNRKGKLRLNTPYQQEIRDLGHQ